MSREYFLLFLISLKFQFCCISRDGENVEENVIREYIDVPLNWPYARNITFRLLYVTLMLPPPLFPVCRRNKHVVSGEAKP